MTLRTTSESPESPKRQAEFLERLKRNRKIRALLVFLALAGLPLWCVLAVIIDRLGLRLPPQGTFDAIVVAGCRVLPGGQPSGCLARRVTKAVDLWRLGLAPTIAMTGGVGTFPPSEAVVAATVARDLGVPESALILEEHSTSTLENARYLRKLVNFERILIVTDSYHVRRCEWFFGKYFREVRGVAVVSPLWDRAKGAFREVIAIVCHVAVRSFASLASLGS